MNILFIHHNFPGQYKHLAPILAKRGHRVVAMGDAKNLGEQRRVAGVQLITYASPAGATKGTHHYLRPVEAHVRRAQAVVKRALELRRAGFRPDVICVHPGWGEALFLRDVFPNARQVHFAEFYYNARGSDVGFDPEFPATFDDVFRVRIKNTALLFSAQEADRLVSPTRWQAQQLPQTFHDKISVVHDGIDTQRVRPAADAHLQASPGGPSFDRSQDIVTFVARNLEPYRGIHTFLRALPRLQELRPNAEVLVVGGDGVSYGQRPPGGRTYRDIYLSEVVHELDLGKIHFLGKLDYAEYLKVLQISKVHVYLTYPFVLSWSALEAMAAGCTFVGSDTAPVREIVTEGGTGTLVDFFDPPALADRIADLLADRDAADAMGRKAREYVRDRFDLRSRCLPRQIGLVEKLARS